MSRYEILEAIRDNPVIMAIKNNKDLKECLDNDLKTVFVLYGDINSIPGIVNKLKKRGKYVIVHEDLIEGLAAGPLSNDFIYKYTEADGIITTKENNARKAVGMGLFTVLRYFVLDTLSYEDMTESIKTAKCDLIEILPGIMPTVIRDVSEITDIPVIAGGLIKSKEQVVEALKADALAISTSCHEVWKM